MIDKVIDYSHKIKTREEIGKIAEEIRKSGGVIATTNGCFDVLHIGHVRSLEKARAYGTLIVGLNSDTSVRKLKGEGRPINSQQDRAYMLASLECVNYVVIFDEDDPRELLKVIKPNCHIKSQSGFKGIEREVVESNGGEIILLPDSIGISTTEILKRLNS